jgi:hypothetical protein
MSKAWLKHFSTNNPPARIHLHQMRGLDSGVIFPGSIFESICAVNTTRDKVLANHYQVAIGGVLVVICSIGLSSLRQVSPGPYPLIRVEPHA